MNFPVPGQTCMSCKTKSEMEARNLRRVGTAVQTVGPGAVTAAAPGMAPSPPLPASVTTIVGQAEPSTNLPGRGVTAGVVHIGVGESVNLSFAPAAPAGYRLKWEVKIGDADILMPNANPTKVTALPTPGNFTVCLVVEGGPHNGHKLFQKEFKVVAPSGTVTRRDPTNPNLRHNNGMAGVGFKMWINLLPDNVVFDALQWREHIGLGLATGHFEGENGRVHAPSGVPYNASNQPTSLLSQAWMEVYGVYPAPYGINWVGQVDTVDTGDQPPALPASPGVPARWRPSSHKWNIEWIYRVKRANGSFSGEFVLERAMHESTITEDGTATIKKVSAGPFSLPAGAPTTSF